MRDQAALDRLGPYPRRIQASPVIGDLDNHASALVIGAQPDGSGRRLTRRRAFGRSLDSVIRSVSNQVRKRITHPFDHALIEFRLFTLHVEGDLFAQGTAKSRTTRGNRLNTLPTGNMRIPMIRSCSSRV